MAWTELDIHGAGTELGIHGVRTELVNHGAGTEPVILHCAARTTKSSPVLCSSSPRPVETELVDRGGVGVAWTKLVEGEGHSDAVVVVDGGGHSTRVDEATLGVVEESPLLEAGTCPGGSRRACLPPKRSRLWKRS